MIWERIKSGDLEALGTLYDEYVDVLYRYGKNLNSDSDYVKDCIHDLFLDIYKYRKNLSSTTNIEYYLLRALKNKMLKKSKAKIITIEFNQHAEASYSRLTTGSIEDKIIDHELGTEKSLRLSTAMGFLTKQQKKGINLRFVEDKSYQEIADKLNVSIETARTVIYRGIKLLRQNMLLVCIVLIDF